MTRRTSWPPAKGATSPTTATHTQTGDGDERQGRPGARAERHALHRELELVDGIAAITDAPDLVDAIAHALALYERTQLAHIPLGGGYATPRWARPPAAFIVAALTEAGWTTQPRSQP